MTLLQFIFFFFAVAVFTWLHPNWAFAAFLVLLARLVWRWTA